MYGIFKQHSLMHVEFDIIYLIFVYLDSRSIDLWILSLLLYKYIANELVLTTSYWDV